MDYLERLLAHMSWADRAALDALAAVPAPDPRWLELFGHVLGAERVWLSRLKGIQPLVAVWPTLTLRQCRTLAEENRREYAAYLASIAASQRDRGVRYTNSAGQEFTSTIEDILLQVFLHGSYHRGQIATLMRAGGAVPAATDYIGFVRGTPAATRPEPPHS